jgi:hypothetical protein
MVEEVGGLAGERASRYGAIDASDLGRGVVLCGEEDLGRLITALSRDLLITSSVASAGRCR